MPLSGPRTNLLAALMGIALVGVVDYATGTELRVYPLYYVPLAIGVWNGSRGRAVALSTLCSATWFVTNQSFGSDGVAAWAWALNVLAQMVGFCTVALLVAELRRRLGIELALSREDPLTRLPNRRAFQERGELLVSIAHRTRRTLALAYLDLDRFKQLNDEHGHAAGDQALRQVADVLHLQLRSSDLCARFGGDEFAMLLYDTNEAKTTATLERVRNRIGEVMARSEWPVTATVGAVVYASPPSSMEQALRDADEVMYRAKKSGRDRVAVELVAAEDAGSEMSTQADCAPDEPEAHT